MTKKTKGLLSNKERKRHRLVDVKRPNFLEEIFPYELPPLIRLDGRVIENIDG